MEQRSCNVDEILLAEVAQHMNSKVEKILEYFNAEQDEDDITYWIKKEYMCCNETGMDGGRLKMILMNNEKSKISFMTDDADWTYSYDEGIKYIEECSIYKIEKVQL